jgi:hypothetical protein
MFFIYSDVATSTYFNADQSKIEYRKQILLRFTTIGTDNLTSHGLAPDKLPPNLYVVVNNRIVPLPQPKPTAKPNSDVIRPGNVRHKNYDELKQSKHFLSQRSTDRYNRILSFMSAHI